MSELEFFVTAFHVSSPFSSMKLLSSAVRVHIYLKLLSYLCQQSACNAHAALHQVYTKMASWQDKSSLIQMVNVSLAKVENHYWKKTSSNIINFLMNHGYASNKFRRNDNSFERCCKIINNIVRECMDIFSSSSKPYRSLGAFVTAMDKRRLL